VCAYVCVCQGYRSRRHCLATPSVRNHTSQSEACHFIETSFESHEAMTWGETGTSCAALPVPRQTRRLCPHHKSSSLRIPSPQGSRQKRDVGLSLPTTTTEHQPPGQGLGPQRVYLFRLNSPVDLVQHTACLSSGGFARLGGIRPAWPAGWTDS
jgi:hypothetical protein